ncbi:hypothetical protein RF55_9279 [Lasius niger]|uniref:Reverse transcriptase/retrotransposon-derived protein RNase H-like domain-containing protein n=1 Tax=Lasius niger TaxID=67767 RepID=A0A0J7NEF3_LASNI|nr:hypothetical protein RF55_9279 [Lasius niger]
MDHRAAKCLQSAKRKINDARVLKYPDFNEEFKVTIDASDYANGAVLSQGPVGNDHRLREQNVISRGAELQHD